MNEKQQLLKSLRLPIIGAPLFIVSNPNLVIEQCKAGIIGAFPALNARPKEDLELWLQKITDELKIHKENNPQLKIAPYAVNQIVHQSNNRLKHDLEMCIKFKTPIVITSLRPPAEVVEAVHSYGGLVFHDVINMRHAKKAIDQGVDGVIAVCTGAGGHAGTLSPFALVKEIRKIYNGFIILSGSMSTGRDVLAAQCIGADLAYMGTRFIASKEANAKNEYKEMITQSSADDIVYSSLFTGIHGSYLKGSIVNAGLDPSNLKEGKKEIMDFSSDNTKTKAWRDIWGAGQGVGTIEDVPSVASLIDDLESDYNQAKSKLIN
ncbi:MAG: nitronate monooxygenase family protein [Pseudomonadota bacterium]|nr:nitronate monooxygenase family protein [Pseudomonadota bacterium]